MFKSGINEICGNRPPVAIGGIGGSGTRLVAATLQAFDCYLGHDLNLALDNLSFTFLFKREAILTNSNRAFRRLLRIFLNQMTGRGPLSWLDRLAIGRLSSAYRPTMAKHWLRQRAAALGVRRRGPPGDNGTWGWKEPNTHVVLERLAAELDVRYIHVQRNGMDMAFSRNQQQLALWGPHYLGVDCSTQTPRLSLKYWRCVTERILELQRAGQVPILVVPFEGLVFSPTQWARRIAEFCGIDVAERKLEQAAALVSPPSSIGRFRSHSPDLLDRDDIAYVESLGFPTG